MLTLVLALAALATTAGLLASCLRLESPVSFALAAYLFGWGEVVVLSELLSLGHWLRPLGYGVGESVALVVAAALWLARGRPRSVRAGVSLGVLRSDPLVAVLGLGVAVALAYEAFVGVAAPENNYDSMTYHLVRATEWVQRGAVEWVPHAATTRVNSQPPNAEIGVAYTLAFLHRETLVALPQLAAEIAAILGVYGIARRLRFDRREAALGALLTATLAEIALESMTTQNDLVLASFVVAAAYFLLGGGIVDMACAGLALGLAAGTKLAVAWALPSLVLLAVVGPARRRLPLVAASTAAGFVSVGAYGFVVARIQTGHFVAPDPAGVGHYRARDGLGGRAATFAWASYRFVDLSGYRRVVDHVPVSSALRAVGIGPPAEMLPNGHDLRIELDPHEDYSYFGPLGALLVVPLVVGGVVLLVRGRAPPVVAPFVLAIPLFLAVLALTYANNPYLGRFLVVPVALTMPLAAAVRRSRLATIASIVVAVPSLALVLAFDVLNPSGLGAGPAVWNMPRAQAQTLGSGDLEPVVAAVERRVPPGAFIGIDLGENDFVYPFYGAHLTRRLIPLDQRAPLADADRRGLRWVLRSRQVGPLPARAGWLQTQYRASGWTLASAS
jgi:Dolichyl-phosphate-mannose-protein mannosyltransferase